MALASAAVEAAEQGAEGVAGASTRRRGPADSHCRQP